MSTSTTNYGFVKPAAGEQYQRMVMNNNLDDIDATLKAEVEKIKHTEYIRNGQADAPANTVWGPGVFGNAPLNVDSAVTENAGWFAPGAGNDQWKVLEKGVYAFTWTLKNASATSHGIWLRLTDPASTFWYGDKPATTIIAGDFVTLSVSNMYLPANTTLQVRFSSTGHLQAVDHRFKFSKLMG